jgi:hypothetical protein
VLAIACGDAPDRVTLAAVVLRQLEPGGVVLDRAHNRLEGIAAAVEQELVRLPLADQRAPDPVERACLLLP